MRLWALFKGVAESPTGVFAKLAGSQDANLCKFITQKDESQLPKGPFNRLVLKSLQKLKIEQKLNLMEFQKESASYVTNTEKGIMANLT